MIQILSSIDISFGGVEKLTNADAEAAKKFQESLQPVLGILDKWSGRTKSTPAKDLAGVANITPETAMKIINDATFDAQALRSKGYDDVQLSRATEAVTDGQLDPTAARLRGFTKKQIDDLTAATRSTPLLPSQSFLNTYGIRASDLRSIIESEPEPEPHPVLVKHDITATFLSTLRDDIASVEKYHRQIPEQILKSTDFTEWGNIKQTVREEWKLGELIKRVRDGFGKMNEARSQLSFEDDSPDTRALRNALDSEAKLSEMLARLGEFNGNVGKLGAPIVIRTEANNTGDKVVMTYDTLTDQRYSLIINAVPTEKGYTPEVERKVKSEGTGPGTFRFLDTPHHNVRLSYGPALLYSFIKEPDFVADKKDNDLVIVKKPERRVSPTELGAMLTLTPERWDHPFFSSSFQLGVATNGEHMSVAGGFGIRVKDRFHISVGALAKPVKRLTNGLVVGQTVATADALKTEDHYKVGGYLSLVLSFDPPK